MFCLFRPNQPNRTLNRRAQWTLTCCWFPLRCKTIIKKKTHKHIIPTTTKCESVVLIFSQHVCYARQLHSSPFGDHLQTGSEPVDLLCTRACMCLSYHPISVFVGFMIKTRSRYLHSTTSPPRGNGVGILGGLILSPMYTCMCVYVVENI